jgi:hypothetical protein
MSLIQKNLKIMFRQIGVLIVVLIVLASCGKKTSETAGDDRLRGSTHLIRLLPETRQIPGPQHKFIMAFLS